MEGDARDGIRCDRRKSAARVHGVPQRQSVDADKYLPRGPAPIHQRGWPLGTHRDVGITIEHAKHVGLAGGRWRIGGRSLPAPCIGGLDALADRRKADRRETGNVNGIQDHQFRGEGHVQAHDPERRYGHLHPQGVIAGVADLHRHGAGRSVSDHVEARHIRPRRACVSTIGPAYDVIQGYARPSNRQARGAASHGAEDRTCHRAVAGAGSTCGADDLRA